MEDSQLEKLRYPIGRFTFNSAADEKEVKKWVRNIEKHPANLKKALKGLDEKKLNTPYRAGGWSVRQVVHHLADSHMNAFIRIKLALSENNPTIKPYPEAEWAEMDDAKKVPVKVSLTLLEALHHRWTVMNKKIKSADYGRTVFHPEKKREVTIKEFLELYSWHSMHHCAHITSLRKRMKW